VARVLGVLPAGGSGARLGAGGPKALARLGGATLLARAAATLEEICDVLVVTAPRALDLPARAGADWRGRAIADPTGSVGPLGGIVAGLSAEEFEMAIVLGVDFPFVVVGTLRDLLERARAARPRLAVIPAPGGRAQPLVAAYAPEARTRLAAALEAGERSLVPAALALDPLLLDDHALEQLEGGVGAFFNLNTPADHAEAERRLAAPRPAPGER